MVTAKCCCDACGMMTEDPSAWFPLRINSWFIALPPGTDDEGLTTHHACGPACLLKLAAQWAEKRESSSAVPGAVS